MPVRSRFVLAALFCSQAIYCAGNSQFLWLSDIHFDPFADPALVDRLAVSESSAWPAILENSRDKRLPSFGEDTNWQLFSSALQAIRHTAPAPAFAIVTGDLLAHSFRGTFDDVATNHSDVAYRSFVRKTYEFVGAQLRALVPNGPIFLSLGNNDDYCGDYAIAPNGPFLSDTSAVIARWSGLEADPALSRDWQTLGSYGAPHPSKHKQRILVLNTNFFSPKYRNTCGDATGEPGDQLLAWLEKQLKNARQKRERVWLVEHIPPGVDGFATSRQTNNAAPVMLWKPSYQARFNALLELYRRTVDVTLAGHTHVDDVRLAGSDRNQVVLIEPALSPIYNQNPAFRMVDVDARGRIRDYTTYFLDLANTAKSPFWMQEYQWDEAWHVHRPDAKTIRHVWQRASKPGANQDLWTLYYPVQHTHSVINTRNFPQLFCASGYTAVQEYETCLAEIGSR
jgi:hypothetical protein